MPLPFAGVSYVDFNLLGTGAQLNAFFGGSYGQLAFSVPSLGGSRWQLAGRAFGIASSYNDRVFVQGREIYEEDIRQRPAQASVWMLRPLTRAHRDADRVRPGLHSLHRGRRDGAQLQGAAQPGGARPARGARRATRRMERVGLVERGAAGRLARMGAGRALPTNVASETSSATV